MLRARHWFGFVFILLVPMPTRAEVVALGTWIEVGASTAPDVDDPIYPALAVREDGVFVVAWPADDGTNFSNSLVFRVFEADGSPRTGVVLITDAALTSRACVAFGAEDRFTVVWATDEARLEARSFTVDGAAVGPAIDLPVDTSGVATGECDMVPAQSGGSLLVYSTLWDFGTWIGSVRSRLLDVDGEIAGPEWIVAQNLVPYLDIPRDPVVTRGPDGLLAAWVALTLQGELGASRTFAGALSEVGAPTGLQHALTNDSWHIAAAPLPGNRYLVSSLREDLVVNPGVFGTRVDGQGAPVAAATQVAGAAHYLSRVGIASHGTRVAFAWHDAGSAQVLAHQLDGNAIPLPGVVVLNQGTEAKSNGVQLAMTPTGRIVAAWSSFPQPSPSATWRIQARVAELGCIDADGDGYYVEGVTCGASDCADDDPLVHPGALDVPGDGVDSDCNPATPGGCSPTVAEASVAGGSSSGRGVPLDLLLVAFGFVAVDRARRGVSTRSRSNSAKLGNGWKGVSSLPSSKPSPM